MPNRIVERRSDPPTKVIDLNATADMEAVDVAERFLGSLAENKMVQAYGLLSSTTKSSSTLAQFVTVFTPYAVGMSGRHIRRTLSASVRMGSFLGTTGPVSADTYVLTFSTIEPAKPTQTLFEIITAAKQQNRWGIVSFSWNTVAAALAPSSPSPSVSQAEPEVLARQVLSMIHRNELSTVYRDFVSGLQKRSSLTTEGAFVSLCSLAVSVYPGAPDSLTLISDHRYDTLPHLFGAFRAEFVMFVFLSKYSANSIHEEVYLVKESNQWKLAAFMMRQTL
jgi:hypothetical protein